MFLIFLKFTDSGWLNSADATDSSQNDATFPDMGMEKIINN